MVILFGKNREMILEVAGTAQNYAWGKLGSNSKVAVLGQKNGLVVNESTPYAELWMGTHPSGPSVVKDTSSNLSLKQVINKDLIGSKVWEKFDHDLPFLLKVLSIQKALSIQAHPDKALAARLHAQSPNVYKDPNHKPEMAIALTPFEAFIGFRPLDEISENINAYPEFKGLLGKAGDEFTMNMASPKPSIRKHHLKSIFSTLQNSPQSTITSASLALVSRLKLKFPSPEKLTQLDSLLLRLDTQFPNDVGLFCALMLNYVRLEAGEAIFLAANEPHAYISGDCVECMAASDNVVRSGLTPKFKDVATLVEMLTYNHGSASSQILRGTKVSTYTTEYNPPIDEFSILKTSLPGPGDCEVGAAVQGPSLLICVNGKGTLRDATLPGSSVLECSAGSIFFVGAGTEIEFKFVGGQEEFTVYRAYCTVP